MRRLLPLLALLGLLGLAPSAQAAQWFDGNTTYQTGTNCSILGQSYQEKMTGSYVSYWYEPDASYPKLGDRYWLKVTTVVTGNTCPHGIADVGVQLALPEGTQLAVNPASNDPNDKVRCFGRSRAGTYGELTDQIWTAPWNSSFRGKYCDSTTVPSQGASGANLGLRLLAQGQSFEVIVPVISTKRLAGMAGTNTKATATITSGVNSTAQPFQWVTVGDRPVAFEYRQDAVSAITDTSAHTRGVVYTWYRPGKVYFDIGRNGAYQSSSAGEDLQPDGGYIVDQDWNGLTPGTDYTWRLRFVDTKGTTTTTDDETHVGQPRTFRTTGTPPGGGGTTTPQPGTGGQPGGGQPGGGQTGGEQPPTTTDPPVEREPSVDPPDSRPPVTTATVARGAGVRTLTRGGLGVAVRCDERCTVDAQLRVAGPLARRLGLGRSAVLARGRGSLPSGQGRVRVRPTGRAARRLRALRSLRAVLVVRTSDAAGNASTKTLPVRLRR